MVQGRGISYVGIRRWGHSHPWFGKHLDKGYKGCGGLVYPGIGGHGGHIYGWIFGCY